MIATTLLTKKVNRRQHMIATTLLTMKMLPVCFWVWFLLVLFTPAGLCQHARHCQWGGFGEWSACDPCTKLQSRSRPMVVYAQFGGHQCGGDPSATRACETTQHCPVGDGCSSGFRCASGRCISSSLVCNGEQDCQEDGLDERTCDASLEKDNSCPSAEQPPPNIQALGRGFDAVLEEPRGVVINTQIFGGRCRPVQGLTMNSVYRIPLSTLSYTFAVKAQKDFSKEVYSSKWEYAKKYTSRETVVGTTNGFSNYDFHDDQIRETKRELLVLKSNIAVATFQTDAPQYVPISEPFWKALSRLPVVYDYTAYRGLLERFGTHYHSEGTLGGSFTTLMYSSQKSERTDAGAVYSSQECAKPREFFFFIPIGTETCSRTSGSSQDPTKTYTADNQPLILRTKLTGGLPQAGLFNMDMSDAPKNWKAYTDWADSLTSFPEVTEHKLRPLSELVKEVPCAGVKRLYLRRAIEQYVAETHPCHCQPCRDSGVAVRRGAECICICKPGVACDQAIDASGEIHGSWSCWSQWTSCARGRRSRQRGCSNPPPSHGGLHCNGETHESSECEDQELEYFKTREPECFDFAIAPKKKCGAPPVLQNGYVLEPRDVYLVGDTIEYRCITEHHLMGHATIQCLEGQTWSGRPGSCRASKCLPPVLTDGVLASTWKELYSIGETVTLSCPPGQQLLGETEIICDPNLHFSPSPASVHCSQRTIVRATFPPITQCPPGEKSSRGKCICMFPYECRPSLEVCAVLLQRAPARLSVCRLHALRCLGKGHTLVENSACQWPVIGTAAACGSCHIWEVCDDQTKTCRCKEASDCADPAAAAAEESRVCVRVGEEGGAPNATMGQCEAGRLRCQGQDVTVVGLRPCDPR